MCPDFSKCTSLRVGLYAVKIRAEAMQEASEAVPSGMLSVLGQRQSKFAVACLEAQEHCKTQGIEDPVCEVANYLFPDCRVISGHLEVGVGGSSLPRTQFGAEGGTYSAPGTPLSLTGALLSPGLGKCLRASVSVVGQVLQGEAGYCPHSATCSSDEGRPDPGQIPSPRGRQRV